MAVKFKEVDDLLKNGPLTIVEKSIIDKVEVFIDKQIKDKFNGNYVSFDTDVLEFKFNPDNQNSYGYDAFKDIKSPRKVLMKKELMRRYEEAGWKWELQRGEDDGPNRPAIDYWHLMGVR